MTPTLGVFALSDSFERVWPELAASAGAELRLLTRAADLPAAGLCGLVIAAGGLEAKAETLLRELQAAGLPDTVIVGAQVDGRLALRLGRAGAADVFVLPDDLTLLRNWVAERVDRSVAAARAQELAAAERETYDFSRMIGNSPGLCAALSVAAKVIQRGSATVLITGETGTGKELLAEAIHFNGPRASRPFVEVNCAALPAQLLEAELFGYEKGAFTDARAAKPGLFEAAHGGTLFLDELGDLSVELQSKLLKAIEEKRVRRLGSLKTVDVDVRIIAATHRDLRVAVREGKFRQDLYYRLTVVPIHLPALRDRADDVLLLAERFIDHFSEEYGMPRPELTPRIKAALSGHAWPGNVRELRNAIDRATLLGNGVLRLEDLFLNDAPRDPPSGGGLPFPAPMETIEKAAAAGMLERMEGNKSAAAEALGISRARLYRLLEDDVYRNDPSVRLRDTGES